MQHRTDVKFLVLIFWCKINTQMPLQNLKRRFGGVIICLSNENMKNFNFPLKHWWWIKIINTTECDPLLKLGRCYPIEINNGRVKSTPNNVIF